MKKIQIDIKADELKKKLNIQDGKTPTKQELESIIKPLIPKEQEPIDTANIAKIASKMAQVELEKQIPVIPPFEMSDTDIANISLDVQSQIEPKFEELKKEIEETKVKAGQRINTGFKSFRNLTDAPHSYNGQAGKVVKVKSDETGLEFGDDSDNQDLQSVTNEGSTTTNPITVGGLTTPYVQFDTTATPQTNAEGLLQWNATDGTLDLGMSGGDITMQVGQEMFMKVRNVSGSTILNAKPVYVSGRTGNRPNIYLAKSDAEATSNVVGITTQDIASPADGYVTTIGYVRGIKTNYTGTGDWGTTWTTGDSLYVSKTVAGQLTNVEPTAPHHSDVVATVEMVHANLGSILVRLEKHKTLNELSDVDGADPNATGDLLTYNVSGTWERNAYNITDYLKLDQTVPQTTVGTFTFPKVATPRGTALLPSYTFTGDTNTGIYSPAADRMSLVVGGVAKLNVHTDSVAIKPALLVDDYIGMSTGFPLYLDSDVDSWTYIKSDNHSIFSNTTAFTLASQDGKFVFTDGETEDSITFLRGSDTNTKLSVHTRPFGNPEALLEVSLDMASLMLESDTSGTMYVLAENNSFGGVSGGYEYGLHFKGNRVWKSSRYIPILANSLILRDTTDDTTNWYVAGAIYRDEDTVHFVDTNDVLKNFIIDDGAGNTNITGLSTSGDVRTTNSGSITRTDGLITTLTIGTRAITINRDVDDVITGWEDDDYETTLTRSSGEITAWTTTAK